jgi:hypothetical protein
MNFLKKLFSRKVIDVAEMIAPPAIRSVLEGAESAVDIVKKRKPKAKAKK